MSTIDIAKAIGILGEHFKGFNVEILDFEVKDGRISLSLKGKSRGAISYEREYDIESVLTGRF